MTSSAIGNSMVCTCGVISCVLRTSVRRFTVENHCCLAGCPRPAGWLMSECTGLRQLRTVASLVTPSTVRSGQLSKSRFEHITFRDCVEVRCCRDRQPHESKNRSSHRETDDLKDNWSENRCTKSALRISLKR